MDYRSYQHILSDIARDLLRSSLFSPWLHRTQDQTLLHRFRRYHYSLHLPAWYVITHFIHVSFPCISVERASNTGRHTQRKCEKERQPRTTPTPTLSWFLLCQEPKVSYQSTEVFIFMSGHTSFVIEKECPASSKKLRTKASQARTLGKNIPESHYWRPINTESLKNDKDLSTATRITSHVDQKPAHFLWNPMTKPTKLSSSQKYFASSEMLPWRTLFHCNWNRNCNLPKADKQPEVGIQTRLILHASYWWLHLLAKQSNCLLDTTLQQRLFADWKWRHWQRQERLHMAQPFYIAWSACTLVYQIPLALFNVLGTWSYSVSNGNLHFLPGRYHDFW